MQLQYTQFIILGYHYHGNSIRTKSNSLPFCIVLKTRHDVIAYRVFCVIHTYSIVSEGVCVRACGCACTPAHRQKSQPKLPGLANVPASDRQPSCQLRNTGCSQILLRYCPPYRSSFHPLPGPVRTATHPRFPHQPPRRQLATRLHRRLPEPAEILNISRLAALCHTWPRMASPDASLSPAARHRL